MNPEPRRLNSNGIPEPLDHEVIRAFLAEHIPYRLALLALAERAVPARCIHDSAFVEAGIVAGRLLMQFLGLGIEHRDRTTLVVRRNYHAPHGRTDEVKITDLGGRLVDLAELAPAERQALAEFYNGASKACAHLTWDSGHRLDLANLRKSIQIIRRLVGSHLPSPEALQGGREKQTPGASGQLPPHPLP